MLGWSVKSGNSVSPTPLWQSSVTMSPFVIEQAHSFLSQSADTVTPPRQLEKWAARMEIAIINTTREKGVGLVDIRSLRGPGREITLLTPVFKINGTALLIEYGVCVCARHRVRIRWFFLTLEQHAPLVFRLISSEDNLSHTHTLSLQNPLL